MCGIIGVVGRSAVNQTIYDGLTVLQHRGQDAAGIITCDDGRLHLLLVPRPTPLERIASSARIVTLGLVLVALWIHRTDPPGSCRHVCCCRCRQTGCIGLRLAIEFGLAMGRAEIHPLAVMLGHEVSCRFVDLHATDRVDAGQIIIRRGNEFVAASRITKVHLTPGMLMRGLTGIRVYSHTANGITGGFAGHCSSVIGSHVMHRTDILVVWSILYRIGRASSYRKVKGTL